MESGKLRVIKIIDGTTVDGPGFRTSIYFAGCAHACPGCHNPQTWPMDSGDEITIEHLLKRIEQNELDVSFSGGDPIYQAKSIIPLAKEIKEQGFGIWCYTGFTFEQLLTIPHAVNLLKYIDVIVDGPFIESLRDTSLLFRGSSNQRLIDVHKSMDSNSIVFWQRI